MTRDTFGGAMGAGIAMALLLQGCGGRLDQVNVGAEQQRRPDLSGMQGSGSDPQVGTPTVTGSDGMQVAQPTAIAECAVTGRTDPHFEGADGTYSSDGSLLALIGYYYAQLQVFHPADNTFMSDFAIPSSDHYLKVAISPDNSMIAASGIHEPANDDVVHVYHDAAAVYRVADGALLAELPVSAGVQHNGRSVAPDFSHDGRLLVTAGGNNASVEIWSVPEFHRLRAISTNDVWGVFSVRFSLDDTRVVVSRLDSVAMWNVADGSLLWSRHQDEPTGELTFSPDGTLVVGAGSSAARIWNAANGTLVQELRESEYEWNGSLSYYDDDHLLIGDDRKLGARIWKRGPTGVFAPSCVLHSWRGPPGDQTTFGDGPATVTATRGGTQIYVHGQGSWIYEPTP